MDYCWRITETINFILKVYYRLGRREDSLRLLSKYLLIVELRFDVMLHSNLGKENSDVGHNYCSGRPHLAIGRRFPTPDLSILVRGDSRPSTLLRLITDFAHGARCSKGKDVMHVETL